MTRRSRGFRGWLPPKAVTIVAALALVGCGVAPTPRPADSVAPAAAGPGTAASAPPPSSPVAAAPARDEGSLFEQAMRCFDDPRCAEQDAARLYLAAADADQLPVVTDGLVAGFHCYLLLRGVGVPADPTRARRCFERVVGASDCSAGSPWLPRLELSVLWLAGRGGPVDPAHAEGLLADCHPDGTVGILRQKARYAASHPGSLTDLDFCRDVSGTTLSMNACAHIDSELSEVVMALLAKEPRFARKVAVRQAYAQAREAFVTYAHAHAAWSRDGYRGGTMAPLVYVGTYGSLLDRRNGRLRAMAEGPYEASEATMTAASKTLTSTYEGARIGAPDGQRRQLLDQAQHAFVGYRKAEIALYAAALDGQHPEQSIIRQVSTDLSRARSQLLADELRER